jgi:MFS family permease
VAGTVVEAEATAEHLGLTQRLRAKYDDNTTLFWVCALIFVNQLGFGSIVPVVPIYAKSFGVSEAAIGLTIAIYGLARFLWNVPAGQISDRYGRRIALAAGGAVTIVGNLICALSPNYWTFLGGRFVAGSGAALVLTGTQVILADISVPANRGRMMATYMGVFLFAVGIGPLPGGLLAEYVSLSAPFYVFALLGIGTTWLAWFRIPETRAWHTGEGDVRPAAPAKMGFFRQLRLLTARRGFLLISIVSFCTFFARTGALFTLIPTFADEHLGLSTASIGLGLAMISIIGMLVAYPSGVLVDRFGRKAVIVPSTIFSGAALVLFALSSNFAGFLLACAVWALSSGIAAAAPSAYAADSAPEGMNAPAMSTYRMLADFGYVAGPLILGTTADVVSTPAALYLTAALVVVAGAVFALLAPETYRRVNVTSAE